jgi:hypothetical protein
MSAWRRKAKAWAKRPASFWTKAAAPLASALLAATLVVVVLGWWTDGRFDAERVERGQDRAEDRARVDRIGDRLVRVERQDPGVCRRSPACRAATRRQQAPSAPGEPGREPRRDRDQAAPEQRADRPPRAPAQPPSTPSPTPGSGGDDPPPPPATSTPSTPPSSPSAPSTPAPVLEVDLPALDLDGPDGLLPQLLPNLPPVDVPPVRLP